MFQAGLVRKWFGDEMTKMQRNAGQVGGKISVGKETAASKRLTLKHLQVYVKFFNVYGSF